jgi:transposase
MPRGTEATEEEIGQVKLLLSEQKSHRQIAKSIKRSKTFVTHLVSRNFKKAQKARSGRRSKLSDRDDRTLIRSASNRALSSGKLRDELNLDVHRSTVYRHLHHSDHLVLRKLNSKPRITDEQKAKRLQWAQAHMTWSEQWKRTIFSDEKKFNLDGPDGWSYYWHDIRKETKYFSKRNFGGGSLMVWLGVSRDYKSMLYVVDGKMDSAKYIALLSTAIIPLSNQVRAAANAKPIFQQDHASVHDSKTTKEWLSTQNIEVLDWASNSPDMNPMENLWAVLVRRVYEENKQYETVEALRDKILDVWNHMEQDLIKATIDSMPNRIFQLIQHSGGFTSY